MSDAMMQAFADAKEFVEAAATDGFDPNDALDLLREIAALSPAKVAEPECVHEWKDIESIGNSEYRTDVRCIHCRVPGERDHADGTVFWPAT